MVDLLYVDEDRAQGGRVVRAAERSGFFTREQVRTILPTSTLDEMIEAVIAENCKVLVTDFDLSDEQLGVQFNGNDLVEEMSRRYEQFPCFVTTNYPQDAVGKSVEVSLIFPKDDYLDPDKAHTTKLTFFARVRQSIDDYDKRYSEKSVRFSELHETSEQRQLEAVEIEELLDLDGFFERALNKKGAVPKIVKEHAIEPFAKLISKASSLVERMESELQSGAEDN
jgi:hypothetical protein